MPQYQFIVLVCAGLLAILGAVKIVTEAIVKKDSGETKKSCGEKFTDHSGKIVAMKIEADAREKRVMKLEFNYDHILEEIKSIKYDIREMKTAAEKNVIMTEKIYAWIDKRKTNGKRK